MQLTVAVNQKAVNNYHLSVRAQSRTLSWRPTIEPFNNRTRMSLRLRSGTILL